VYQTEYNGEHHELGTSGFLYRSNKLMYDAKTKSLWSTLQGRPVVGPLVPERGEPGEAGQSGIQLSRRHVVTTTWGNWKKQHPETTVLSLDTGHDRDYGEGVAYAEYFSTDRLMFEIPQVDKRLRNKDEVFALREGDDQLAISATFLTDNLVYHEQIDDQPLVILTDRSGANRAYRAGQVRFVSLDEAYATDVDGNKWQVTEASLQFGDQRLVRLAAHRVFWFGWHAQYPESRLVK